MLDEDSTVALGDFCEEVLRHPYFQTISHEFEQAACRDLLATPLNASEAREAIWAEFQGGLAFTQFMVSFVEQRNKIVEARELQHQQDTGQLTDEEIFGDELFSEI
jgi:hypothetical protein